MSWIILKVTSGYLFFTELNESIYSFENRSLKFIALGHIYPIINDEIRMNSLFKKINPENDPFVVVGHNFVEIKISDMANWLLIIDFKEILDLILSILIVFSL